MPPSLITNVQFATRLLEETIRDSRRSMAVLATGVATMASLCGDAASGQADRDSDQPCFEEAVDDMIDAIQNHDIIDQRLSHILTILREEDIDPGSILTEQTERQIWEAMQSNSPYKGMVPPKPGSNGVELFE